MFELQIDTPTYEMDAAESDNRQLLISLQMAVPEATIAWKEEPGIARHRDPITTISVILAAGVKLGAFSAFVQVVKMWSDSRPKTKVTLKAKDGSTVELTNVGLEKAIQFYKEHNES